MNDISNEQTNSYLKKIKAPSRFGLLGYVIVIFAYLLALLNFFLPKPIPFIQITLQPMIFVGIASLLYHIGQHLHALHENVIRMALEGMIQNNEETFNHE